jgi:hypothetical protein
MQRIYREVEPGVEQRDARHLGQAFRGAQCSGELHYLRKINILLIFFSSIDAAQNSLFKALYSVVLIVLFNSTFDLLNSSKHISDYLTAAPGSDILVGIVPLSHIFVAIPGPLEHLLKQTLNIL